MGGERAAVVKLHLRAQQETVGQTVGGYAHGARRQPVHGVGLIARTHHQRGEGEFKALRRVALQDVAVERIEGQLILVEQRPRPDLREHAAFRRLRIDVGEMLKIRRQLEIAEGGYAVMLGLLRGGRQHQAPAYARGYCGSGKAQGAAAAQLHDIYDRCGALAALSLSHHQIFGNAALPYFGIVLGRPKRSQRTVRWNG